jgi:hypothetical protein
MMSAILLSHIKSLYLAENSHVPEAGGDEDDENCDDEQFSMQIALDQNGSLMTTNQVDDYYHCGSSLAAMNFFDFARCVKVEKLDHRLKNTPETWTNVYRHHNLNEPHPLARTHGLVEFWNDNWTDHKSEHVLRITGCSIPRSNAGLAYAIFVLAHFKPFGVNDPVLRTGETFEQVFEHYTLSDMARTTLQKWDATNECENARDAERM